MRWLFKVVIITVVHGLHDGNFVILCHWNLRHTLSVAVFVRKLKNLKFIKWIWYWRHFSIPQIYYNKLSFLPQNSRKINQTIKFLLLKFLWLSQKIGPFIIPQWTHSQKHSPLSTMLSTSNRYTHLNTPWWMIEQSTVVYNNFINTQCWQLNKR